MTRRPLRVVVDLGRGLSGEEERSLMVAEEEAGVAIFAGVGGVGFGLMGLLSESFEVSSAKAASRRSTPTTSPLPFSRTVNVLSDRLSALNAP